MKCAACVHLNPIPGRESCAPHGRRSPDDDQCRDGYAFPLHELLRGQYGKQKPALGDLFGAPA